MTDRYNKVTFANVPLHEYFRILEVKRSVLPSITNFSKEISGANGEFFMRAKYGVRKITLSCAILSKDKEDYMDTVKNIAFVLDVHTPEKLIIGDDEDIFYYAKIDGETDLDKTKNIGKFEINFICYDPFGYSVEDDYFDADTDGIVTVDNGGTTEAYPVIDTVFEKTSNFFMVTNYDGRTILLGTPMNEEESKVNVNSMALREPCETLENWVNVSEDILDDGRKITGTLQVNASGKSLTCTNFGTYDEGWHGGALRRNIGTSVGDFEFKAKIQHNSKGTLYINDGTAVSNKSGTFIVTAKSGQPVYQYRSTSSKKITTIPKNKVVKVTEITKDWGAVTYSGKSGFVNVSKMQYKKEGSSSSSGYPKTYKGTVNTGGANLMLRKGKGTKYSILKKIPNKTSLSVIQEKSSDTWLKTTYGGKTGYVSKQYIKAQKSSKMIRSANKMTRASSDDSAERQKGRIEITGFSKQGDKLFKCVMRDSSKYYEYTEPEVWIGNTMVLSDGKSTPDAKTRKEIDEKGKTVTNKINSGKYGAWNEFDGWFTIKRTTDKRGKQTWECKVEKLKSDGTVERTLPYKKTSTTQFPQGELASIVVWIGQWKNEPTVTTMQCSHLQVKNLKTESQQVLPIFTKGDELVIDNETQKIYLNGSLFMTELDIGSEFFSCPTGESQFKCVTDGGNLNIGTSIKKRWV